MKTHFFGKKADQNHFLDPTLPPRPKKRPKKEDKTYLMIVKKKERNYRSSHMMKTIGLLGGMSWESTLEYYRLINMYVNEHLGKLHSGKILMYSFDFQEIEELQHSGDWDKLGIMMAEAARKLERAGAELMVICTNTMHKVAGSVERNTAVPLIHIADAAGEEMRGRGIARAGLLGTKFTMSRDFYRERLKKRYDINVIIPGKEDMKTVHEVIYNELVLGMFKEASRNRFQEIIDKMVAAGAEGIILGCTEIPLLIKQEHVSVPVLDTLRLHAEAAAEAAIR